jgi:hypothetical protein
MTAGLRRSPCAVPEDGEGTRGGQADDDEGDPGAEGEERYAAGPDLQEAKRTDERDEAYHDQGQREVDEQDIHIERIRGETKTIGKTGGPSRNENERAERTNQKAAHLLDQRNGEMGR